MASRRSIATPDRIVSRDDSSETSLATAASVDWVWIMEKSQKPKSQTSNPKVGIWDLELGLWDLAGSV